jgi:hypothetical protein
MKHMALLPQNIVRRLRQTFGKRAQPGEFKDSPVEFRAHLLAPECGAKSTAPDTANSAPYRLMLGWLARSVTPGLFRNRTCHKIQ